MYTPDIPPEPWVWTFKPRRWWLWDEQKLVKIKSFWPSWDSRYKTVSWPVLLVDGYGQRSTVSPIWTWGHFIAPFWDYKSS